LSSSCSILLHVDEDAAVAALGDLPLQPQFEIPEGTVRHQIAENTARFPRIAQQFAIARHPLGLGIALVVQMPALQGLSIEQKPPTFGLLGLRKDVVPLFGFCAAGRKKDENRDK